MNIQINTDKNLHVHEAFGNKLEDLLSDRLKWFRENITRLEVHFSDENGSKDGVNNKRCLLEARLEGKQPITVTAFANTYDLAVDGAIDKLKASLNTILGRSKNHQRN